jgi:hypothetical protein
MSIDVILPAPRAGAARAPASIRHVWRPPPARPVLGLIDNFKPRAGDLLQALGRVLQRQGVVGSFFMVSKASASETITREQRAELLARAHVIVSGVGD